MDVSWIAAGRLAATVAVALLLVGTGRIVDRSFSPRTSEMSAPTAWLIMGWAIVSLAGALCATFGLALFWPALCLGIVGIAGCLVGVPIRPLAQLTLAWLIVVPLLLIASTIPPTMYDEFAQWLPNTRFLLDHDRFPDIATPNIWSARAAYPPAVPIIGYAVQALIGRGWEIAAKIFCVVLAASFGLTLAELIRHRVGNVLTIVIGVAFATVFNPFFDPRLALTAYADVPTEYAIGFLAYAAWRALDEQGARWLARAVAAGVLLVLLRETNVVLLAGVAFGLALTGRRGRMLCVAMMIGPLATFLIWRNYISGAGMPPSLLPAAFAEWQWDAPFLVARTLVTERLANHLALGGSVLLLGAIVIAALVWHWRVFLPIKNLLLICGAVTGAWVVFVLWSYIAVLGPEELALAGSTWRYLSELGAVFLLACFAMLAVAFPAPTPSPASKPRLLAIAACLLPGLFVIATHAHWQIDLQYPLKRAVHSVAAMIEPVVANKPLVVVHPIDAKEIAIEIDFDLHRPVFSSTPSRSLDGDSQHGLALDLSGFEGRRCPRLLLWANSGWTDVSPAALLQYCTRVGLVTG